MVATHTFLRFAAQRLFIVGILVVVIAFGARGQSLTVDGDPTLVISSATAGAQPDPAEDQSTTLTWSNINLESKITVSTSCPGQSFTLTAEAINVTNGTSMGTVTLKDGMTEQDFVQDIQAINEGSSTLYYRAEASADQGIGTDQHSITFTLLAQ